MSAARAAPLPPAAALRALLDRGRIVVAPGAYDAWSARLVASAGFPCVYMTGFGASASQLGVPDLGLMTGTEMADQARRLAAAAGVPLIADADTGFGGVLNVGRTVRDYIRAGVAGIQIEDQVMPKRCGHMESKSVVSVDEMTARIRAAVDARADGDIVIIARTDARATHGVPEAMERARRCLQAGADVLFIEAPRSVEELRAMCREFPGVPMVANMVEAGKTPYLKSSELEALGVSLALYPVSTLFAATRAVQAALGELATDGRIESTPIVDFAGFNSAMGLDDYLTKADRLQSDATPAVPR